MQAANQSARCPFGIGSVLSTRRALLYTTLKRVHFAEISQKRPLTHVTLLRSSQGHKTMGHQLFGRVCLDYITTPGSHPGEISQLIPRIHL